jgi:ABC-type Fe3+-hydroxamate transport system substrate-binding protein
VSGPGLAAAAARGAAARPPLPPGGPRRIVSLVPSLTESLFALGLGERVVGVTEWCVHPASDVARLPKLGGTKTPDLAALRALAPDLVLANREENRKSDVAALESAGIPVWVSYPRTVREGAELLAALAELGAPADRVEQVVTPTLAAVAAAAGRRPDPRPRVFCAIWRSPWMSVGRDTYIHDMIELCGGANVFAERPGRRYPVVTEAELLAAAPEVVLLPDEPYRFDERDAAELRRLELPAARVGRIHLIDGTLVSWYGPRIGRALETLQALFAAT